MHSAPLAKRVGVTLAELLVAVSIFAFIIASSYLMLRGFNRVYKRGEFFSEFMTDLRTIERIMNRDFKGMCIGAEGDNRSVAFYTMTTRDGVGYLSEVHYSFEGDALYRYFELESDMDLTTQGEGEALATGCDDARFSYYDKVWYNDWKNGVPKSVRLEISWKDKKRYAADFLFNTVSK